MKIIKDYYRLIESNFRNKKLRSFLTTLGIIIGVALIIILISLGQGMQNAISYQFNKIGIKSIRIVAGDLHGPPNAAFGLDKNLQQHIERVRGVDYVNPVIINDAIMSFDNEGALVSVFGYETKLSEKGFVDTDVKLESGRFFTPGDKDSIIIGHNIANTIYNKKIRVKNSLDINGRRFRVIGIFEKTGTDVDSNVYMPLETSREMFGNSDIVNVFIVQIKDGINIDEAAKDIDKELLRVLKNKDAYKVFTPAQLVSYIQDILGAISVFLTAIAGISLIVGAVGIMNSMYTFVLERTREIGVMKAVGARRKDILLLFLFEAGLIGLVGGIIGITIGVIVSYGIGFLLSELGYELVRISVSVNLILGTLLFSFIVGLISGILPAYRGSKMQAVEALRYE